ncbi:hypothetical protein F5148DRAFT_4324 [Russula earlei]|uniref:Uncharacterized protein n=1 Tax=Russula earlei TaxID=71964 RepID=A0ACC0UQB9_9AGAM|nr:hypothetical protein F5148DRAFT_4324 [Russula earlei]
MLSPKFFCHLSMLHHGSVGLDRCRNQVRVQRLRLNRATYFFQFHASPSVQVLPSSNAPSFRPSYQGKHEGWAPTVVNAMLRARPNIRDSHCAEDHSGYSAHGMQSLRMRSLPTTHSTDVAGFGVIANRIYHCNSHPSGLRGGIPEPQVLMPPVIEAWGFRCSREGPLAVEQCYFKYGAQPDATRLRILRIMQRERRRRPRLEGLVSPSFSTSEELFTRVLPNQRHPLRHLSVP